MLDGVDRQIIHALQCSPRASFRRIGRVVGVSEQTVARRYQALCRDGVLRVLGLVDPAAHGNAQWVARIRCRPDRVDPLADALARRPDIAFAHLASGGSEIICIVRSPVAAPHDDVLLGQLPRASSVLDVSIDLLLHRFGPPGAADWVGYSGGLSPEQVRALVGDRPEVTQRGPLVPPTDEDAPLLASLAQDGRASHARLAALTGWTKTRVARRMRTLEAAGTLYYDVELLSERLGHRLAATLWLRVAPSRLQAVGEELAGHDQIPAALATSGPHNIMAVVICRDPEDLYRYLTTHVAAVRGIEGYEVSISVRRLKQAASVIAGGRLVHPLSPTPQRH